MNYLQSIIFNLFDMEYKQSILVVVTLTESMEDMSMCPAEYSKHKTSLEKVMPASYSKTRLMWWMRSMQRYVDQDTNI